MKWLDYFSIRQKLAILLFFLLSAVSYIAITTIYDTNQHKQDNINIDIAQQQHLIVEQFINAFFFARQQANISGEKINSADVKKNQFLFEQNIKAMLYGGKTYLDLNMKRSIKLDAIASSSIRDAIKESQKLWKTLQSTSQNLPLKTANIEQLLVFHHLSNKLREKLTIIVISLTQNRDDNAHQDLLVLQLSWLFILIMGTLFTWFIAKNITQPLDNIAKVTSRIRLGDLTSYPLENSHRDELGTLFYQADEMRLVLSELMLTIQQHNKQLLHSSKQVCQLSGEMSHLHHLQFTQHENVATQVSALQKQNQQQLNQLTEQSLCQQKNQDTIEKYWQALLLNINGLEDAQDSNNLTTETISHLKKVAEQLAERLSTVEQIATKTQDLARKTTIDAARSGKQSEQFTLVANQVTLLATETACTMAEVSPLLSQFQVQLNELAIPIKLSGKQLAHSQASFQHSNEMFESLKDEISRQKYQSETINKFNEQQSLQLTSLLEALKNSLNLIKGNSEKSDANNLFSQDLNKIALQLEQLSQEYKVDEKSNRARRGNDKRVYPRINNQLTVSLQQADNRLQGLTQDLSLSGLQLKSMQSVQFNHRTPVKFTITPPNIDGEQTVHPVEVLGDVVHYEQIDDSFYYGVRFHPLSDKDKNKLQHIFDYFEKKSEFKS